MDDREYLSGTHYEYVTSLDAKKRVGRPEVWLYQKNENIQIDLSDSRFADKKLQYDRVQQFFADFYDSRGQIKGGINAFATSDEFERILEGQLRVHLRKLRDVHTQVLNAPSAIESKMAKEPAYPGVPYRGLRALSDKDAELFFGRDAERLDLLTQIKQKHFVFVLGNSGSGKSSLVAAGILPHLKNQGDWRIAQFTPGASPYENLATALHRDILNIDRSRILAESQHLESDLRTSNVFLGKWLNSVLESDQNALLFVDQFEELYTLSDKDDILGFSAMLRSAIDVSPRVVIIATLRADFSQMALDHFPDQLNNNAFWLKKPSRAALREMIVRPAELAGIDLEPGLDALILVDAGEEAGSLALVAFILEELGGDALNRPDRLMSIAKYTELGGVQGAIARRAEAVFTNLPGDTTQKDLTFQHVFEKLVGVDDRGTATRRRAPYRSFNDIDRQMIDILVGPKARLLVIEQENVEVAHEALLRSWPRLARWIETQHEDLIVLQQVRRAAEQWQNNNYNPHYLWHHQRLQPIYDLLERRGIKREDLDSPEREFITPWLERYQEELHTPQTDYRRRATIGDLLLELGSARKGVGLDSAGLPDIAWLEVQPATIELRDNQGKPLPRHNVSHFWIARFPITVWQFAAFRDAQDGFSEKNLALWWAGLPRELAITAIRDGVNPAFSQGNRPMTNISWYNALAFCNWFTAQLRRQTGILPSGYVVRLPTEWEWLSAATGGHKDNLYPWGTDKSTIQRRANVQETPINEPIAVGMFPEGETAAGVADMCGSVWEWCLNKFDSIEQTDLNDQDRARRGGSFMTRLDTLQDLRSRANPSIRRNDTGFRVICALPVNQ
jgi:formylglycine-generating enzyme required for sulfatase activity